MNKLRFTTGLLLVVASLSWFWHAYRYVVGESVEPWMLVMGLLTTGMFLLGIGVKDIVDA